MKNSQCLPTQATREHFYEQSNSNGDVKSDFHLIGMFLVGPRFYFTNEGNYPDFKTVINLTVSVNGTDIGELPLVLVNQKEHIFLSQGDNFRIRHDPEMNSNSNIRDIEPHSVNLRLHGSVQILTTYRRLLNCYKHVGTDSFKDEHKKHHMDVHSRTGGGST